MCLISECVCFFFLSLWILRGFASHGDQNQDYVRPKYNKVARSGDLGWVNRSLAPPRRRPAVAKFLKRQPAAIVAAAIVWLRGKESPWALAIESPTVLRKSWASCQCVCAVKGSPSSARVCYCKSGLCFNTLTLHMDVIFPSRLLRSLLQGRIVLLFFFPLPWPQRGHDLEKKLPYSHPRRWWLSLNYASHSWYIVFLCVLRKINASPLRPESLSLSLSLPQNLLEVVPPRPFSRPAEGFISYASCILSVGGGGGPLFEFFGKQKQKNGLSLHPGFIGKRCCFSWPRRRAGMSSGHLDVGRISQGAHFLLLPPSSFLLSLSDVRM